MDTSSTPDLAVRYAAMLSEIAQVEDIAGLTEWDEFETGATFQFFARVEDSEPAFTLIIGSLDYREIKASDEHGEEIEDPVVIESLLNRLWNHYHGENGRLFRIMRALERAEIALVWAPDMLNLIERPPTDFQAWVDTLPNLEIDTGDSDSEDLAASAWRAYRVATRAVYRRPIS